jgi:hypothetical protein
VTKSPLVALDVLSRLPSGRVTIHLSLITVDAPLRAGQSVRRRPARLRALKNWPSSAGVMIDPARHHRRRRISGADPAARTPGHASRAPRPQDVRQYPAALPPLVAANSRTCGKYQRAYAASGTRRRSIVGAEAAGDEADGDRGAVVADGTVRLIGRRSRSRRSTAGSLTI